MKKLFLSFLMMLAMLPLAAANKYDNPDTLVVSRDGTGEFRTIDEAIEVCRAFMDYTKVIYVKKGVYKEKLIIPTWLTNITICGEDRDQTIITWDDHANILMPIGGLDSEAAVKGKKMGTFRTYTLKVAGQLHHAEGHHHREQCCQTGTSSRTPHRGRPCVGTELPSSG